MKVRAAICGALAALGAGGGALAIAQTPAAAVPTVAVNAGVGSVAVVTPGPVAAGPTNVTATRTGGTNDINVTIGLAVPGVTQRQLESAAALLDRGDTRILSLFSVQASITVPKGQTTRTVGLTLKPGLTYYVIGEYTKAGGKVARTFTTLTTSGASNGATAATPDATVRLQALRFKGDAVLPQKGTVRIANIDGTNHIAIAFPLKKGVTSAQALSAARKGTDAAFGRVVGGAPYELEGVLSGGDTYNDQTVSFSKKGKYLMVCFIDGHDKLGMYRVVSVR